MIAVTGGGSGALAALLQTPGASRTILEAVVPYSLSALTDWIGAQPEQACSAATARAMAVAAYERARRLAPDADPKMWVGVGATASLATDRPKRGERRGYVAYHIFDLTWEAYYSLDEFPADRASDELIAAEQTLSAVAKGCTPFSEIIGLHAAVGHGAIGNNQLVELLHGQTQRLFIEPEATHDYVQESEIEDASLLFPGAFNPPHHGHLEMIAVAERRLGKPAMWELSVANVDKPPLDHISIYERLEALREEDPRRLIALTRAPTFREKSELFPNATFVVGADTLLRIADPKYYGGDPAKRDAAIAEIAARGCRFLAFGRILAGKFTVLSDLALPPALAAICDEVPASEFREDISSTQLRTPPAPQ